MKKLVFKIVVSLNNWIFFYKKKIIINSILNYFFKIEKVMVL